MAQPPEDRNSTNVIPGLVGVSFLLAITLTAYGIRMYSRRRPVFKLGATDYIISAALLCELITLISLWMAIHFGLGHYDDYISAADQAEMLKWFFVLGILAFWASSLARISIGCMLLRFELSTTWKVFLYVLIFIQLAMAVGADIFQLLQCRPIRALWEQVPGAVCWSAGRSQSYSIIYASMGIVSDLIFAIIPIYFIWPLHRPRMERILLIVLMGLGLIAAVAGAMKLYYAKIWNPRAATFRNWVPLLWWYRVEELGLIAAACAPFLKPVIERLHARFGGSRFHFLTIRLNTIRSGLGDPEMDAGKTDASSQRTCAEQRMTQNSERAASTLSSGSVDHSSGGMKSHTQKDHTAI